MPFHFFFHDPPLKMISQLGNFNLCLVEFMIINREEFEFEFFYYIKVQRHNSVNKKQKKPQMQELQTYDVTTSHP